MKENIFKALKWFLASFDNYTNGASGRKLSAFIAVNTAVYISIKEVPTEYKLDCVYAWQAFALVALGLVTVANLIELKNGTKANKVDNNGEQQNS